LTLKFTHNESAVSSQCSALPPAYGARQGTSQVHSSMYPRMAKAPVCLNRVPETDYSCACGDTKTALTHLVVVDEEAPDDVSDVDERVPAVVPDIHHRRDEVGAVHDEVGGELVLGQQPIVVEVESHQLGRTLLVVSAVHHPQAVVVVHLVTQGDEAVAVGVVRHCFAGTLLGSTPEGPLGTTPALKNKNCNILPPSRTCGMP